MGYARCAAVIQTGTANSITSFFGHDRRSLAPCPSRFRFRFGKNRRECLRGVLGPVTPGVAPFAGGLYIPRQLPRAPIPITPVVPRPFVSLRPSRSRDSFAFAAAQCCLESSSSVLAVRRHPPCSKAAWTSRTSLARHIQGRPGSENPHISRAPRDRLHTMVAQNPLFVGWSLKKFKATVINDIWPEVLFFTAVAASESDIFSVETS